MTTRPSDRATTMANPANMTANQLEVAARTLCQLRGVDPDERVGHGPDPNPDGTVYCVMLYSPAWRLAAREIVAAEQMSLAIAAGRKVVAPVSLCPACVEDGHCHGICG